jgi:hypothetical protein
LLRRFPKRSSARASPRSAFSRNIMSTLAWVDIVLERSPSFTLTGALRVRRTSV